MKNNPVVTIEMENGGVMKVELYPETAPNTVANFISLVEKGFYNGTIFHRVIPGFMIQGGDPEGTGMGGPGYRIKGEFTANRFQNDLKHTKGVISMARSGHPDSAGSQFFIMVDDAPHLDGQYASFGKVIEGIEVADQIVSVATNYSDRPLEEQRMRSVTVETFGRLILSRRKRKKNHGSPRSHSPCACGREGNAAPQASGTGGGSSNKLSDQQSGKNSAGCRCSGKGNAAEKGRLTALLELLCLSRMRRAAGNRLLCGQPELSVNCFPPNWLDRCSDTKKQEKGCGEIRILF